MNDDELKGRLNGLSLMIETLFEEVLAEKIGPIRERRDVIISRINSLTRLVEVTLPDTDFRRGTLASLKEFANRVKDVTEVVHNPPEN